MGAGGRGPKFNLAAFIAEHKGVLKRFGFQNGKSVEVSNSKVGMYAFGLLQVQHKGY